MARQSESNVSSWGYAGPVNAVLFDPRNPRASYTGPWYEPQSATRPLTKPLNTLGDWSNPATPSRDNSQPILNAINRRQGGNTMSNDAGWSNTPAPAQRGNVGGGFEPSTPPTMTPGSAPSRSWQSLEPRRGATPPAMRQPDVIGRPIVDIAPAPAPQPSTTAPTKVGGPSGFMEQFDAPTMAMPSVDQLYKTYTDMAGENQGMREYLASPQFQGLWQSGNVPYWMLSDPVWRSYLQKIGLLNWDALARRMGRQ